LSIGPDNPAHRHVRSVAALCSYVQASQNQPIAPCRTDRGKTNPGISQGVLQTMVESLLDPTQHSRLHNHAPPAISIFDRTGAGWRPSSFKTISCVTAHLRGQPLEAAPEAWRPDHFKPHGIDSSWCFCMGRQTMSQKPPTVRSNIQEKWGKCLSIVRFVILNSGRG